MQPTLIKAIDCVTDEIELLLWKTQLPSMMSKRSHYQSGRVVKAYEYYQTCIATKTFEFFGFLSEARNDTQNLIA